MNVKTKQIMLQCVDANVAVTYANGSGAVVPPKVRVCQGNKVIFHFAGPRGTADITPKDPADASWLEKPGIPVPGTVEVDTSPAIPGVPYRYTVIINAHDHDGSDFSITIDPIVWPQ